MSGMVGGKQVLKEKKNLRLHRTMRKLGWTPRFICIG